MKEDMMDDLSLTIHFTFFHTDPEYPEADTNWSIAHDIAGILSEHGYSVNPVFPGDCGRYKFEVLQEIEGTLNDNRDLITSFAELLNPVVTYFLDRWERRLAQKNPDQPTIIVVQIGREIREIPIRKPHDDATFLATLVDLGDAVQNVGLIHHLPPIEVGIALPPRWRRRVR